MEATRGWAILCGEPTNPLVPVLIMDEFYDDVFASICLCCFNDDFDEIVFNSWLLWGCFLTAPFGQAGAEVSSNLPLKLSDTVACGMANRVSRPRRFLQTLTNIKKAPAKNSKASTSISKTLANISEALAKY